MDQVHIPDPVAQEIKKLEQRLSELEKFRVHKKFDVAWCECSEIRRDYLVDCALKKQHDPSFSKFIIQYETEAENAKRESEGLTVSLEVLEK